MKRLVWLCIILILAERGFSQFITDSSGNWMNHFQATIIDQAHSGFKAKYSGMNSLADSVETGAESVTATLFVGRKLWKGAAVYVNPELSGGRGLSYALGVAGALNGETYRIGDPAPVVSVARAYIQQMIPLGGGGTTDLADGNMQVAMKQPAHCLEISAGKFSMSDFFDANAYAHDPRSQFMNWSLMANGAWDYPANTKGYTMGVVVEWINPNWSFRVSSVAVPVVANHPSMEYKFGKAHSETAEFEQHLKIAQQPGVVRLLLSYSASRAPSYEQGLEALKTGDQKILNVIDGSDEGSTYGGKKTGLGLGLEQSITDDLAVFGRLGWNDGKHVSWAFTEIDQTVHLGLSLKGAGWKRKDDVVGLAGVVNGISADHRAFLAAGGYGFIIGDGALNYGHESIVETYYNCRVFEHFYLSFDYQFVHNPGYNKDRSGPVSVFALRGHIEF